MTPRLRFLIAGLIGLSLAGAPAINAAASVWCGGTSKTACQCCHNGSHKSGCEVRCSEPPTVSGITSSDHASILRPSAVQAARIANELTPSYRVPSALLLTGHAAHAPPKRYLLACTFRL